MFLAVLATFTFQDALASESDNAEYMRLSSDMHKLAQRNAWTGVERTFVSLQSTGVDPTFQDFMVGAQAAQALGDVSAAKTRLQMAHSLREDAEIIEWMWDIDSSYGEVFVAVDVGSARLSVEEMPFDPRKVRAIEFAKESVAEVGMYRGFLPQGTYYIGEEAFVVEPVLYRHGVKIDHRTPEDAKKPFLAGIFGKKAR